ncbi:ATP-dependent DNA helicase yku80 [Oleoguttula sp. CCFEE 5521]
MREELLDLEVPYMYNEFLRELKRKMLGEELGGDRRLLWVAIKNARLGLVQRKEVEIENLPEEEAKALFNEEDAKAFWSMPKPKKTGL